MNVLGVQLYTVLLRQCAIFIHHQPSSIMLAALLFLLRAPELSLAFQPTQILPKVSYSSPLFGWIEKDGEWEWEEDDPSYVAVATPQLPSKVYKPKQSLGQNYLKDPNTVLKIVKQFERDAPPGAPWIELGPGMGALTDRLMERNDAMQVIEIDDRSVDMLREKHPQLEIRHEDVLQTDYAQLQRHNKEAAPLAVIGNLPYYITSQILFCLADASHVDAVASATVTMQLEVAQRMVASTRTKDYGILSVVFQLYADVNLHFKIPPTVFYPQPKVDSALVGLHFCGSKVLRQRLQGVRPADLRKVVLAAFQQRRKTLRKSLQKILQEQGLQATDLQHEELVDWDGQRPEELTSHQFVLLTKLLYGSEEDKENYELGHKVWRKSKHGKND